MAMEVRRQRKLITVPDENKKTGEIMNKLNIKNTNEIKRSVLGDIASNRINPPTVSLSNSSIYKSKLPVLKAGYSKAKLNVIKPKPVPSKENKTIVEVKKVKASNINSIIDKTKNLKLEIEIKSNIPVNIEDIDKEDHRNPFLVAAYAKDIYDYLKYLEKTHPIKEDYLKTKEVTPKTRAILIDWLVDVQQEYHLLQETLHIAVGILDSYLQNAHKVNRSHLQLIGMTALFLACKYEETTIPAVEDLVYVSASTFKESDLFHMEREMFRTIGFDISRPISLSFLRRYSKAAYARSDQHTYAKYFLELSLIEYSLCHVYPSLIASAALYLALFVTSNNNKIDGTLWTKTLEYYSGYKFDDFKFVLKTLAKIVINAKSSKLTAIIQKYSSQKFFKVSLNTCLYSERMEYLANSK
ncbi:hypothetical protein PGB90_009657 [Kerria lacca]